MRMILVKKIKFLAAACLFGISVTANATLWNIENVLTGSSGFGASSFHEVVNNNYMSGTLLGTITTASGMMGTYDDVTGAFSLTNASLSGVGGATIDLVGNLSFGAGGLLDQISSLTIAFAGNDLTGNGDLDLFFKLGYQCCGSTDNDPNTFNSLGNGILTLWGANGWNPEADDSNSGNGTGDYSDSTTLGMDLRLKLTQVPEPTSLILMSLGLFGLGFRKFKT
jgi:hypothetical protein